MMNKQSFPNLTVLLIDDDPISNLLAQIKLRQLGIKSVTSVENGLRALNHLQSKKPDLILLDINMPTMDGFEFLNANEKYNLCPETPIVMLTSSVRSRDRNRALQYLSVIEYIEKPLTTLKIERVLVKLSLKDRV